MNKLKQLVAIMVIGCGSLGAPAFEAKYHPSNGPQELNLYQSQELNLYDSYSWSTIFDANNHAIEVDFTSRNPSGDNTLFDLNYKLILGPDEQLQEIMPSPDNPVKLDSDYLRAELGKFIDQHWRFPFSHPPLSDKQQTADTSYLLYSFIDQLYGLSNQLLSNFLSNFSKAPGARDFYFDPTTSSNSNGQNINNDPDNL